MKLFALFVFLSAQICFGSKKLSLETKFSKVEQLLERIQKNPDYGTYCRARTNVADRYVVQLQIPPESPAKLHYFGEFVDQGVARNAALMIVETYKKSLELNSPATALELKLKCTEMFATPKSLRALPVKPSLLEKIERNPTYGMVEHLRDFGPSYCIQVQIPPETKHFYGTLYDKQTARKAILMLAKEYLESLEEGKSPATAEDLQKKFDDMFGGENLLSKFEKTMKRIRRDPNFGVTFLKNRTSLTRQYTLLLSIPPGSVHWYGLHPDHASARKAVLMIAEDYLKSLKESPATYQELRQKYGSMAKKAPSARNKLTIEGKNGTNLRNVENDQVDQGKSPKVPSPIMEEEDFRNSEVPSESTVETFPSINTAKRYPIDNHRLDIEVEEVNGKKCVLMSFSKRRRNQLTCYKVLVSRLQVDENVNFPYDVDGWRTYLERGEVFTVTDKKTLIDNFNGWNRIRGYCEECDGWVTLKHLDIGLEVAQEVKKRKRTASETSSETSASMEESTNYGSDN